MRVVCGIQARMSSTRFPGKVMADLCGKPMIRRVYDRVLMCEEIDETYLLIADEADKTLLDYCESEGLPYRLGPIKDVRARYINLLRERDPDLIVRVCGDFPLIHHRVIDQAIREWGDMHARMMRHDGNPEGFFGGFDIYTATLLEMSLASQGWLDREHVAHTFVSNLLSVGSPLVSEFFQIGDTPLKLAVNTPEDLEFIRGIWAEVDKEGDGSFPYSRVIEVVKRLEKGRAGV